MATPKLAHLQVEPSIWAWPPDSNDAPSAAEEYAQLTGEEIFAASRETSRVLNGQILAKAIVIVQLRTRCSNLTALASRIGWGRVKIYRGLSGRPINDSVLCHALYDLASFLEEQPR